MQAKRGLKLKKIKRFCLKANADAHSSHDQGWAESCGVYLDLSIAQKQSYFKWMFGPHWPYPNHLTAWFGFFARSPHIYNLNYIYLLYDNFELHSFLVIYKKLCLYLFVEGVWASFGPHEFIDSYSDVVVDRREQGRPINILSKH